MSSPLEDVGKEMFDKVPDLAVKGAVKGAKLAGKTLKGTLNIGAVVGGKTIKGVCLILGKGLGFTTHNVMRAVKALAYNKTGNIEFSNQNIDMVQLQRSGQVTKIDENITAEVMKHFNDQCKKYGVKYSAMKDERDPENPSYMVFYNGKSAEIILHVMKEAYKDYVAAQKQEEKDGREENSHEQEKKSDRETDFHEQDLGNKKGFFNRNRDSEPRESVRAKLAFFRDRVADRENDREALEKKVRHADRQR